MNISNKAQAIYQYIVTFKEKYDGNSPSFREIAIGCDISSTSMVNYYLDQLIDEGLIEMAEGLERSKIMVKGGEWRLKDEQIDLT
jgi:predicted transcriptional regulator